MKYWENMNVDEYVNCVISFLFPMFIKAFGEHGMKYVGVSIDSLTHDIKDEDLGQSFTIFMVTQTHM
jgi:MoaA/NifB/PqqE/SkfB family radical SAM enzyme